MGKSEYAEKLKSPKWQRRRLEIMERDNFTCQICGNKDVTLNVHHLYYNDEPWDAEDKDLITLCEICHKHEHDEGHVNKAVLHLRENGITTFEIKWILEALSECTKCDTSIVVDIFNNIRNKMGYNVVNDCIYDALHSLADRRNHNVKQTTK